MSKKREWARRYIPAEILGTVCAVAVAWVTYAHSHSYAAATAAGWTAEGIGFYGYFISTELRQNAAKYKGLPGLRRIFKAASVASHNLLIEFAPAELLDNFLIRPFAMYAAPQHIHPYPVGFLVGKFGADIVFYALAIAGYEARKRWAH